MKKLLFGILSLVIAAGVNNASAVTIISDTFVGTDGQLITSHSPDVNITGSGYVLTGAGSSFNPQIINPNTNLPFGGNYAILNGSNTGSAISLASSGGYTKPTNFTLSADLFYGQTINLWFGVEYYSVGLGFYNTVDGTDRGIASAGFNGVALRSNGDLVLMINGVAADSVATGLTNGNFNFHTLTYSVNTTTGLLSGVSLDNVSYNFSTSTAGVFSNANTAYVGFGANTLGTAGYYDSSVLVDNFTVSTAAIPEPSSLALLGLVGAGMLVAKGVRRRRSLI